MATPNVMNISAQFILTQGEYESVGRPYAKELQEFGQTYLWAIDIPIDDLANPIEYSGGFPLLSIGSGGSLTVAAFWSMIHEYFTGHPAKYGTPLELLAAMSVRPYAIGLVTARGTNPDIVQAFQTASSGEPKGLIVLTFAKGSRFDKQVQMNESADIARFAPPTARDGFLATNSLLASMVLLYRAYCSTRMMAPKLPASLPMSSIDGAPTSRATYSILYAGWGTAAAIDLESKLIESGLADVHHADVRNFAHGRHHWLAKRAAHTTIVALVTPTWADLFDRTLALLPPEVDVIQLRASEDGPLAAIELVTGAMHLIGRISSNQGADPGRPKVPEFGRRLYHLPLKGFHQATRRPSIVTLLSRKLGDSVGRGQRSATITAKQALRSYLDVLRSTTFRGIVFDYDGTLSNAKYRNAPLLPAIVTALTEIADNGINIGVASGRGRSVGDTLRQGLDRRIWNAVLVGYYNGGDIRRLDAGPPLRTGISSSKFREFFERIQSQRQIAEICSIEARPKQITLIPTDIEFLPAIHELVLELMLTGGPPDISVTRSSHSIDVIDSGVSKQSVVEECHKAVSIGHLAGEILRIGDSGNWCGNDFTLLSSPLGLSVDKCPRNSLWAWNLASPGHIGPDATLDYVKAMRFDNSSFKLDVDALVGDIS